MATIGKIYKEQRGGKPYFHGVISTMHINLKFELDLNTGAQKSSDPYFFLIGKNAQGEEFELGAAWQKMVVKEGQDTWDYLSMTIDDLSFDKPLNVAAFKNQQGGWDINYRRRQNKSA